MDHNCCCIWIPRQPGQNPLWLQASSDIFRDTAIFLMTPFSSSVPPCKCILRTLFGSCKGLMCSSEIILPLVLEMGGLLFVYGSDSAKWFLLCGGSLCAAQSCAKQTWEQDLLLILWEMGVISVELGNSWICVCGTDGLKQSVLCWNFAFVSPV